MSKKVLFITYIDFGDLSSGSKMRPQKMYNAFLEEGHDVKLLSGRQFWFGNPKRKNSVIEIYEYLQKQTPDICYIESSIETIYKKYDRDLIKKINSMGIPIGYYLRDDHEKLGKEFLIKRKGFKRSVKSKVIAYQKQKEMKMVKKYVDIVYFPTQELADLFHFYNKEVLPPGGEHIKYTDNKDINKIAICVGGISKAYGTDILLEAFEILNKNIEDQINQYKLILIGREKELAFVEEKYRNTEWLKIVTASGNELIKYYNEADIGVIARPNSYYNSLAFSIKIMEYISHNLPIVVTNNLPMKKFVEQNGVGLVTDYGAENFAKGIQTIFSNNEKFVEYKKNIKASLSKDNLWIHRVEKVISDLLK